MNPLPNRKSPRMKGYDYHQSGAYFVTLCAVNRVECFGEIVNGIMRLSPLGRIADEELARIPDRWADVEIDAWVVMPNHVHMIVVMHDGDTVREEQRDGNRTDGDQTDGNRTDMNGTDDKNAVPTAYDPVIFGTDGKNPVPTGS